MANDSYKSPKGKTLTKTDQIMIPISRADLPALHAVIEGAMSSSAPSIVSRGESRIAFCNRIIRIRNAILNATWDHDDVPQSERSYE